MPEYRYWKDASRLITDMEFDNIIDPSILITLNVMLLRKELGNPPLEMIQTFWRRIHYMNACQLMMRVSM